MGLGGMDRGEWIGWYGVGRGRDKDQMGRNGVTKVTTTNDMTPKIWVEPDFACFCVFLWYFAWFNVVCVVCVVFAGQPDQPWFHGFHGSVLPCWSSMPL